MDVATAVKQLEAEWNLVELTGFFGELKVGIFDREGFRRVKLILDSVELPQDKEEFSKRFVEVTWFIPTFLHWQRSAWVQRGKDLRELDEAISFFEQRLTTILGLP